MSLAPIAVFAYARPQHTERLLASLRSNPEARASQIFVFSDGSKSGADLGMVRGTRDVVRRSGFPRLELVERAENRGLAANVVDGVTRLCAEHGRVIALEDDLVLAPTFLRYMNEALDRYAGEPSVYQVAGYMYPVELDPRSDAVFLPFISSWGWATWARAWAAFDPSAAGHAEILADRATRDRFDLQGCYTFSSMLRAYLAGRNRSWAIRWYLSVFRRSGLALFPRRSLVENQGFGADATHCDGPAPRHATSRAHDFAVRAFPSAVAVDGDAFDRVRLHLRADTTVFARATRKVLRLVYRVARR